MVGLLIGEGWSLNITVNISKTIQHIYVCYSLGDIHKCLLTDSSIYQLKRCETRKLYAKIML